MFFKSFPIQPFVALLIIVSSLTSPVNATPVARTSFARDLRRDSAGRSIEDRQFGRIEIDEQTFLLNCVTAPGNSHETADMECLFGQGNFDRCIKAENLVVGSRLPCLQQSCPNISNSVMKCVVDTPDNLVDPAIGDNGNEASVDITVTTVTDSAVFRRSFETQAVSITDRR